MAAANRIVSKSNCFLLRRIAHHYAAQRAQRRDVNFTLIASGARWLAGCSHNDHRVLHHCAGPARHLSRRHQLLFQLTVKPDCNAPFDTRGTFTKYLTI